MLLILVVFAKLLNEHQCISVVFHIPVNITEAEYLFMFIGRLYFCIYELPVFVLGSSCVGPLDSSQCDSAWPCAYWIAFTSEGFTLHVQRSSPALRFYI